MLRLRELDSTIHHSQAVGERPYGHFDHDANCMAGPAETTPHPKSTAETPPTKEGYILRIDATTGEYLYFPR